VVTGADRAIAEVRKLAARSDLATIAGIKALQRDAKKNVKARMRGRPRWDRRGASERTGDTVDLNLSPHHVSKQGGPGRLTGSLARAVGGSRRVKKRGPAWVGGVGVGGVNVTNLYKRRVETTYPFLEPGVKKTEAKAEEIVTAAWRRIIP
jgi:hypothetical protein